MRPIIKLRPLLIIHTVEPEVLPDTRVMVCAAAETLAKNELFKLVITYEGGERKKSERGEIFFMMNWIKVNKASFSQLYTGVANTIHTSAVQALYILMLINSGSRKSDHPAMTFTRPDHTLTWAQLMMRKTLPLFFWEEGV